MKTVRLTDQAYEFLMALIEVELEVARDNRDHKQHVLLDDVATQLDAATEGHE